MTTTDMAYWWVASSSLLDPTQKSVTIPHENATYNGENQIQQFGFQKDVTIGPPGLPANVIEYVSTFLPSGTTPPQAVTSSVASAPGVYLRYPQFSEAWTYDLATRTLLQHHASGGADDMIKVMKWPSSPIGPLAFAVYASENLQPYEGATVAPFFSRTFGWWIVGPSTDYPSTFLNTSNYASGPLPVSYRAYMVVGNPDEVTSSLDSLDLMFSSLDPEVFSWREYIRLNNLPSTWTQAEAQADWLSNGIAAGRAGSYHFAPGPYRDLNSDQWGKSYQGVIDHYIQYGRKEGRTTAPRPQGGIQHTIVRSPQPDFVPVRASGSNANGQLGDGTTNGTSSPIRLPNFGTGQRPTDVAAGAYTSLAVLADGTVWMWGSNTYGARGDGSAGGQYNSPVQVPYLPPIVVPSTKDRHVVAAGLSACAVVDSEGKVWTWGANWNGQLGDGTTNNRYTPAKVQKAGGGDLTDIVSISIGQSQMVALDIDEHVWTWGWGGGCGALGNNTTGDSSVAVQVKTDDVNVLAGITQVAAGGSSFCIALARNGLVYGWGNNGSGQLGQGDTASRMVATAAGGCCFGGIDKIAAGSYHVLAHSRNDGNVYVWGYNGWGQLGLSGVVNQLSPTPMPGADTLKITDVAAGFYFSLLTRATDRTIFGLGDNQSGQLGNPGDYTAHNQPIQTSF